MGETTSIGWTDHTRNGWMGCSKVHEICPVTGKIHASIGVCEYCYVERDADYMNFTFERIKKMNWNNVERDLKKWSIGKVFLNDFTDWMHPAIPDKERLAFLEMLHRINDYTYEKHGQLHQFQMLTKRATALANFTEHLDIPHNFWMGVSIGNKPSLYYLHELRNVPARIRFVSFEPLVEDLEDNDRAYRDLQFIDKKYNGMYQTLSENVFDDEGLVNLRDIQWIIIGGESGKTPRPMKAEWAERLITSARKYGASVFFKQMGGVGNDGAGGDKINGRQIKEFPTYN